MKEDEQRPEAITGGLPAAEGSFQPGASPPSLPISTPLAPGLRVRLLALRFMPPGARGILWRFLVLTTFAFWQGGFVFYSAVVVPVAMSVLRPPRSQSFVTLDVTRYLNLAGLVTLLLLGLEVFLTRDGSNRRRIWRWLCWLLMTVSLGALFWLHPRLAAHMDRIDQVIVDREAFYPWHRLYLGTSTAQWFFATIFLVLTLRVWQEEDWKK